MNDIIYLLLGGNVGDRLSYLALAQERIAERCGEIRSCSSFYETAAWGNTDLQPFLNQAIGISSPLLPLQLLREINQIEKELGRERVEKWGARTIDIDIIFYGHQVVDTPELKIPHPLMQERRFVLVPLAEIIPGFVHPVCHKTVRSLLEECTDPLPVALFDNPVEKQS